MYVFGCIAQMEYVSRQMDNASGTYIVKVTNKHRILSHQPARKPYRTLRSVQSSASRPCTLPLQSRSISCAANSAGLHLAEWDSLQHVQRKGTDHTSRIVMALLGGTSFVTSASMMISLAAIFQITRYRSLLHESVSSHDVSP
jgi:hypothetical protein